MASTKINTDGAATLIVAWRGGRNAYGRVLKTGGGVTRTLRQYAAAMAQAINEGRGRPYDPDDEQDEEIAFLSANRDELLDTALLTQIERGASLPLIAPDELRQHNLALYALLIGNHPNTRTIFIRKGSPVKLAAKSLVAIFDQTLTQVTDPILAFDRNFDVVLRSDAVWVINQRNFEGLFKESEAVLAKTAEWVDELGEALPIDGDSKEWLAKRLRQTSVMRRKVQSILRSGYLSKLTPDVMRERMLAHGLNPDELIRDGTLVFNKDTESSILLFLNEDLWTGDFSGEHYAATRKAHLPA